MKHHLGITIVAAFALSIGTAYAQCPAVGADSTCGTVITITDAGASISNTGQGPYDGIDDTLVGVINNTSNLTISSLTLNSSLDIFGFDGDGIDTYGIPGNDMDDTGYGGPNAYFTGINGNQTSGTVDFIVPIPPRGGTAYFSLENSLGAATACSTIINNALATQASGENICATFTPNQSYTLSQAAQLCGFKNFDWIQQITVQYDPSEFYALNQGGAFDPMIQGPVQLTSHFVPWSDPPQGGGYLNGFGGSGAPDYSYPFYYDQTGELAGHEDGTQMVHCTLPTSAGTTLTMHDAPADGCLPGGTDVGTAKCDNTSEPAGSYGGYLTHLAGVNNDGTAFDLGIGFAWTSNYNGTTGGIQIKKTNLGGDGNGTGGTTVTNVNQITNYQYPRDVGVIAINGIPTGSQSSQQTLLGGNQISASTSRLTYDGSTQTFDETVMITNISGSTINGPFQVVLASLTPGAVVTNQTGTFGGYPYLTVLGVSSLGAGQSAMVTVQFKTPASAVLNFVPITYAGTLS